MRRLFLVAALLGLVTGSAMAASVVDFETTPSGGTPVDNTLLSAPYTSGGVSVAFYFDVNGNNTFDAGTDALPVFERAGNSDPVAGFAASVANDTADPGFGAQLGQFFLRQPPVGQFGANIPGPFIVDYNTALTITALSGEIWDIDGSGSQTVGTERWRVDVLDSTGNVLATSTSPLGTQGSNNAPLDGKPWVFGFTSLPTGVDKVRLSFIGSKTSGIGLAFNNFSPTTSAVVPEPSTLAMAGIVGLAGFGCVLRRRRRANV